MAGDSLRRLFLCLVVAVSSLVLVAPATGAVFVPPPNDNFADATDVGVVPFGPVLLDASDATTEPNDPDFCWGSGPTVWFTFTPDTDMRAEANTLGSNYDTTLSVYTGPSHAALEEIACNDDANPGTVESRVRWDAEAGVEYFIMVGAYDSGPGGSLRFHMPIPPAPVALGVAVDRFGSVTESAGIADISGTVNCAQPRSLSVFGLLIQESPEDVSLGFVVADDIACSGSTPWSVTVFNDFGNFVRGPAFVEVIVYDQEGNEQYTAREVRLRPTEAAPEAQPDGFVVDQGKVLTVAPPGVLRNDRDPEGSPLTAVVERLPQRSAAFSLKDNGSFVYRSERFSFGPDTFTYRASDGFDLSKPATVSVNVLPTFSDVPAGHLFSDDIRWIGGQGITQGCNPPVNFLFCPDDSVSRGQMAAFIARTLGLPPTAKDYFDDDNGSVFEADINSLARAGIVRGCNPPANTHYCPNQRLNRGAMATILAEAFGFTAGGSSDLFIDDNGSVHERNINRLGTARVTRGCNPPANDRYCPNDPVTRAQMAAFLRRAMTSSGTVVGGVGLSAAELEVLEKRLELARP